MRAKHGARFWIVSLVTVFVLQGVLMWIVSLGAQLGQLGDRDFEPRRFEISPTLRLAPLGFAERNRIAQRAQREFVKRRQAIEGDHLRQAVAAFERSPKRDRRLAVEVGVDQRLRAARAGHGHAEVERGRGVAVRRDVDAGLDLGAKLGGLKTSWGEFGLRLNGTLTLKSERQTGDGDPFISNLGVFINDGVVQRWRHSLSLDWESGPFSATLSNSYLQGYDDQHIIGKPDRKVAAYSLWNLSGGWDVTKALTLRAGVQNLANTAPPFSQQAWFFISGYDPSYTDSRGRFIYASVKYTFR